MPRTQARLPEPSGVGYIVLLLAICVLIALNSVITAAVFFVLQKAEVGFLEDARIGQPLLFLGPLILLSLELWLFSSLHRRWSRARGREVD